MKTQLNLLVNSELRDAFFQLAQKKGTTVTSLLNAYMQEAVNSEGTTKLYEIPYEDCPQDIQKSFDAIKNKKLEDLDLINI